MFNLCVMSFVACDFGVLIQGYEIEVLVFMALGNSLPYEYKPSQNGKRKTIFPASYDLSSSV